MSEIAWGEGDIRDAMSYFDPDPADIGDLGVTGERGGVVVCAYWTPWPALSNRRATVYEHGLTEAGRGFTDPIEAIQFALSLARGNQDPAGPD